MTVPAIALQSSWGSGQEPDLRDLPRPHARQDARAAAHPRCADLALRGASLRRVHARATPGATSSSRSRAAGAPTAASPVRATSRSTPISPPSARPERASGRAAARLLRLAAPAPRSRAVLRARRPRPGDHRPPARPARCSTTPPFPASARCGDGSATAAGPLGEGSGRWNSGDAGGTHRCWPAESLRRSDRQVMATLAQLWMLARRPPRPYPEVVRDGPTVPCRSIAAAVIRRRSLGHLVGTLLQLILALGRNFATHHRVVNLDRSGALRIV